MTDKEPDKEPEPKKIKIEKFKITRSDAEVNELKLLEIINRNTDDFFIKTPSRYATHDFSNKTTKVELKSRSNKYADYNTTMISSSKINKAIKDVKFKHLFYFMFSDGLYRISLENLIKNSEEKIGGLHWKKTKYLYIDIKSLELVDKNISSLR